MATSTQIVLAEMPNGKLEERHFRIHALAMDFRDKDAEAFERLAGWVASGEIAIVEDVLDALESAPAGLIGLLAGENQGKRMIRVGPDPA